MVRLSAAQGAGSCAAGARAAAALAVEGEDEGQQMAEGDASCG